MLFPLFLGVAALLAAPASAEQSSFPNFGFSLMICERFHPSFYRDLCRINPKVGERFFQAYDPWSSTATTSTGDANTPSGGAYGAGASACDPEKAPGTAFQEYAGTYLKENADDEVDCDLAEKHMENGDEPFICRGTRQYDLASLSETDPSPLQTKFESILDQLRNIGSVEDSKSGLESTNVNATNPAPKDQTGAKQRADFPTDTMNPIRTSIGPWFSVLWAPWGTGVKYNTGDKRGFTAPSGKINPHGGGAESHIFLNIGGPKVPVEAQKTTFAQTGDASIPSAASADSIGDVRKVPDAADERKLAQVRVHADGTIEQQDEGAVAFQPQPQNSSSLVQGGQPKQVKCPSCNTAKEQSVNSLSGTKTAWHHIEILSYPFDIDDLTNIALRATPVKPADYFACSVMACPTGGNNPVCKTDNTLELKADGKPVGANAYTCPPNPAHAILFWGMTRLHPAPSPMAPLGCKSVYRTYKCLWPLGRNRQAVIDTANFESDAYCTCSVGSLSNVEQNSNYEDPTICKLAKYSYRNPQKTADGTTVGQIQNRNKTIAELLQKYWCDPVTDECR